MATDSAQTLDTILGGALTIVQPMSGYRFAVDSVLLGNFAEPTRGSRVLELRAGSGVVAIMLAAIHKPREVVAVEIQAAMSAMISQNAAANGIDCIRPVFADIRVRKIPGLEAASFDYVVANPPYRAARSGRESPLAERRIARGAAGASLRDFVTAAARYAKNGGKVAMVFTAIRSAELITELRARALEPKRIRFVHPMPSRPATMVLVEARKDGGVEVKIDSPLFLYDRPGVYSAEAQAILGRGK